VAFIHRDRNGIIVFTVFFESWNKGQFALLGVLIKNIVKADALYSAQAKAENDHHEKRKEGKSAGHFGNVE